MSDKPVEFHPEALAEARDALSWYQQRSARAARALLIEIDEAVNTISAAPQRWPIFEAGCRRYPLTRFPYWIVYEETLESIRILAVAHGRRRPGYWRIRKT